MTMLFALIPLMTIAASPAPSLTAAQQRALEQDFVCPASLPDDDARILDVRRFVIRYGAFAPRSTMAERMAFRDHLLAKHHCPEMEQELIHTFPET